MKISHTGNSYGSLSNGSDFHLNDMLLVPDISNNLIYVNRLGSDNNVSVE